MTAGTDKSNGKGAEGDVCFPPQTVHPMLGWVGSNPTSDERLSDMGHPMVGEVGSNRLEGYCYFALFVKGVGAEA